MFSLNCQFPSSNCIVEGKQNPWITLEFSHPIKVDSIIIRGRFGKSNISIHRSDVLPDFADRAFRNGVPLGGYENPGNISDEDELVFFPTFPGSGRYIIIQARLDNLRQIELADVIVHGREMNNKE